MAKAKLKNIVQFSQHEKSKVTGERLFIDLSSVKSLDWVMRPNRHWHIIVDEFTNFKVSNFYQKKDLMAESTCELI